MKPPEFEFARPASVEQAVALLAQADGEGKVLAGGQSLVPLLNFRLASPRLLVDINLVDSLTGITRHDHRLSIGAMTRMRRLETDPLVRDAAPLLSFAASWVGHVQIRNRGTVGGSIAHADPAAEIPAMALLLDARMTVVGPEGPRTIPADDFYAGFLTTDLADDELLTDIDVALPAANSRWGFREFAHRHGDFALAGAAVLLPTDAGQDEAVDAHRVVLFGTADRPVRARGAEQLLAHETLTTKVIGEAARAGADEACADDPRPDATYRRTLTETMLRRAIEDATSQEGDR